NPAHRGAGCGEAEGPAPSAQCGTQPRRPRCPQSTPSGRWSSVMRLASQPMTPPMTMATMKPFTVLLSLFEDGANLFSSFQQVRHQPFTACVFQPVAIPDGQDRGGRN